MGRRSTLDTLPPALRDLFHRLVRDGRTIEEITDKLNELDAAVSTSAVGRSVKRAREQMRHYREAQAIAGQWVAQLGENPTGDVGGLLAEMLKTVAFQSLTSMAPDDEGNGKPAKPMDIMLLAKAIKDLESTAKQNLERREKDERKALQRQAKAAEKVAKKQGMSKAHWDQLKAGFLGIPVDEAP